MDHFKAEVFGQKLVLRDMVEDDVETIVGYWHDGDPAFLRSFGADISRLGPRDATRERLLTSLQEGLQPGRAYFLVASEAERLAYTNLNFRSATEACAHFHVLKRTAKVRAIMYVLFPEVIKIFFSRFQLERIEMQLFPRTRISTGYYGGLG